MYIPNVQSAIVAGMALTGTLRRRKRTISLPIYSYSQFTASSVSEGKILDFAVEKCIDADGNKRCSTPFLVSKSTCYEIEWSTEGTLSHTTVEVRDAGSDELVYYRDTNGQWTPEKGEASRTFFSSENHPNLHTARLLGLQAQSLEDRK
jgi:hypothetical protein